ncbi:hypothetical protein JAAARDRAFT_199879 [Jaapia argillacea MUCL 33604]|uniref:F-box domain-containing protein n=1 Tax=Jaapia argillacea MUCL 33604 TaxID=933084 RepID=A0A067P6H2_9AGAM|nr:hypothetical protein JAAARDRAFT_199879 [Jaapia argillacea MUCL 33604]
MPHMILATRFPVELYRPIISFIDKKKDLCTLCLSSRTWYGEATPFLYQDAFLSSTQGMMIWCNTTVEKPFLGELVQELSILFRMCWRGDSYISVRISQMLRHVPNLQRLTLDVEPQVDGDVVRSEVFSVFQACPLQIRHFDARMFLLVKADVDSLVEFVKPRPNITNLSCRITRRISLHALETILPNLARLVAPSNLFLALKPPRPIQCLKMYLGDRDHIEAELEGILVRLKAINETLTTLCLYRRFPRDVPLHKYICRLAKSVPKLQSLCIHDDSLRLCREPPHLEGILSSFTDFTCLENVAFNQYYPPPSSGRSQIPCGMSPTQFATRCMEKSPSLYTVMLPFWDNEKVAFVKTPSGDVIEMPSSETSYRGTCLFPKT